MTLESVRTEIELFRYTWGYDIVTDISLSADNRIAEYIFMKDDKTSGYIQQYDLINSLERHCGLASGCFWTDWKEA